MKALLTGVTGMLGWEVLQQMRHRPGVDIKVLVRPATLANTDKGRELQTMNDVEIIRGDMSDSTTLYEAVEGVDIVYHMAWKSNRGNQQPQQQNAAGGSELARFNIDTTQELLNICEEQGIARFVYTSTVAVYGSSSDMQKWPVNEETPQEGSYGGDYSLNYIEPKREIEAKIKQCAQSAGFEYVILRPAIIYGADAPMMKQMVQRVLQQGARGGRQGQQQVGLQVVHVYDAARAVIIAGEHKDADGREFNIAGNEVATPEEMQRMMQAAVIRINRNMALPGRYLSDLQGYSRYDTTKADQLLGFKARVSLPEGLAEAVAKELGVDFKPTGFDRSTARIARAYDQRVDFNLLAPVYDNSDFLNFGYWEEGIGSLKEACENQVEKLLAMIPNKDGTILDVACGKGATTRQLLNYYPAENVTAINIARKHLEVGRKNAPGATFLLMDAAQLEFPDNSIDNIICVEAAGHFNTRDRFLLEAYRVLKPGGQLVLSDAIFTPRSDEPEVRTQQEANYVKSAEEYEAVLKKAGFINVHMDDVTAQCWGGFQSHLRDYLQRTSSDGSLDTRVHSAIARWFKRIEDYIELYVLGGCSKPRE